MSRQRPYADTPLSQLVTKRVLELRPVKSQIDIATEAGFRNPNVISMIRSGATRLPLDRVQALAKALDCDPKRLFLLALAQDGHKTTLQAVTDIFGTVVTRNEVLWLEEIRDASAHGDPTLTARARSAIRAVFGK